MSDYGQDVIDRGLERLKGTWTYNGEEYDLLVEDISRGDKKLMRKYMGAVAPVLQAQENGEELDEDTVSEIEAELERLGSYSWVDGELGDDPLAPVMREKLVQPEADPDTLSDRKFEALIRGMFEAFEEADDVAAARDEMPLEGNA
jgi:hypothetical protein